MVKNNLPKLYIESTQDNTKNLFDALECYDPQKRVVLNGVINKNPKEGEQVWWFQPECEVWSYDHKLFAEEFAANSNWIIMVRRFNLKKECVGKYFIENPYRTTGFRNEVINHFEFVGDSYTLRILFMNGFWGEFNFNEFIFCVPVLES